MPSPVSVVMPTTARNRYLEETVGSLVAQTHEDWELVLVLDGDCEANREVATAVAGDRVRFVVTPAPRSGPAVARNLGVEAARHEMVAFLDSDDLARPERLAAQVEALTTSPELGFVGAWAAEFDESGPTGRLLRAPEGTRDLARQMVLYNSVVTSTVIARRAVVDRVGPMNPECVRLEDYDLWLRLLAVAPALVLPEVLVDYRRHSAQLSRGALLGAGTRPLLDSRLRAGAALGMAGWSVRARHAAWLALQVARRRW